MANEIGYPFQRVSSNPLETDRSVNTITQRDAIPSGIRWRGMLVHVVSEDTTYELRGGLLNTNWAETGGKDLTATHFRGNFDATAIDPSLDNSSGVIGDEYKVINGGVDVDFGSGDIRLNTGDIIIFHNNEWRVKVSNAGSSNKQPYFEATEGQTVFNVDASADNIDVWVGGVYQIETQDYNRVSGTVTLVPPYTLSAGDRVVYRTYSNESSIEPFTATASQTVFTLTNTPRTVDVHVGGVYQIQGQDYNISENIITFTYGLASGDKVTVRKFR